MSYRHGGHEDPISMFYFGTCDMGNASKSSNLREAAGFWVSAPDSERLTAKREIGRRGTAIHWQRIFYAAAAAVVLATAVLLASGS